MIATLGLALLAGVLSILSPCVLPLLPIVLGTAQSEHRLGPVALRGAMNSAGLSRPRFWCLHFHHFCDFNRADFEVWVLA